MASAFNHVGLCVSDLAASRRFYTELLGFEPWFEVQPGDDPSAKLVGLDPPVGMTAHYLRLDGLVLELLHYEHAGTTAPRERPMNEPGLTHLSVAVDDIPALTSRVADYGGSVLDETDIGAAVFVTDPDGQKIELLPMSYRGSLPPAGDQPASG